MLELPTQLPPEKIELYHSLAVDQMGEMARSNTLAFTKTTMPEFRINWHHRVMGSYLDKFVRHEITRLMVFMPPRMGKSEMTSRRLPAHLFGQNPNEKIIAGSYSQTVASSFNRDVQRIIDSPRYRAIYPGTCLAGPNEPDDTQGNYVRNSQRFEIVGHRGFYHCAGVGGALTSMGADTLLLDDPIKNEQEADSEVYRNHMWEWWQMTFRSRLETKDSPGRILVTLTRWHEDDLAGRLLALAKTDPNADQWRVVEFPAIREDLENPEDPRALDEPLWPEAKSLKELLAAKAGSRRAWVSLYQQKPSPPEGTLVKRGWWKYYKVQPQCTRIIQSWDLSFKGNDNSDFVVGQIWGKLGADFYLLDQIRGRLSFTEQIAAFRSLTAKWPAAGAKFVEDAANGAALIDMLRREISGIIPVRPKGDKVFRVKAVSHLIEAGNVYLPDPSVAPWVHDYVEEWAVFPNGRNDDQVDTSSQAMLKLSEAIGYDFSPMSLTQVSKWIK